MEIEKLRNLVMDLLRNDPDELVADGVVTVLDVWRRNAMDALDLPSSPEAAAAGGGFNPYNP